MAQEAKQGIALLLFGVGIVSIQDVLIKLLSATPLPIHELLFIRYAMALLLFGWLVAFVGDIRKLRTQNLKIQIIRGLLAFFSGMTYYLALSVLPLAETIALFFSAPLFVTLFGFLFFGEKVGRYRWAAAVVGFIGMLVMVRPGDGVFEPAALLAVFAAVLYAFSLLLIRKVADKESAVALSFYSMICNFAGSGAVAAAFATGLIPTSIFPESLSFLTRSWIVPDALQLGLILGIAVITVIAFYAITQAYRIAAPSVLAVFEYSALFWGLLWGITLWGEYPDNSGIIGILLVVGAGVFTIIREANISLMSSRKWFTGRALSRFR